MGATGALMDDVGPWGASMGAGRVLAGAVGCLDGCYGAVGCTDGCRGVLGWVPWGRGVLG